MIPSKRIARNSVSIDKQIIEHTEFSVFRPSVYNSMFISFTYIDTQHGILQIMEIGAKLLIDIASKTRPPCFRIQKSKIIIAPICKLFHRSSENGGSTKDALPLDTTIPVRGVWFSAAAAFSAAVSGVSVPG